MREFKIISLRECAEELAISESYTRRLFRRTEFDPIFRINQVAYYMRYDFDAWRAEYLSEHTQQLCTMELCTA